MTDLAIDTTPHDKHLLQDHLAIHHDLVRTGHLTYQLLKLLHEYLHEKQDERSA